METIHSTTIKSEHSGGYSPTTHLSSFLHCPPSAIESAVPVTAAITLTGTSLLKMAAAPGQIVLQPAASLHAAYLVRHGPDYRTDKCFGRKIINYFGRRKFKEIIFLPRRNVKTNNKPIIYPLTLGKAKWLTKQYLLNTPDLSRGSRSNVKKLIIDCWVSNVPKAFVGTVPTYPTV
jgi:hypothetical protein